MLITSFCQDGQFFELIIELIGEAIGEMMVFDLNVISFNDVIKNCSSLVPINLITWNDVNCVAFMQKVSHYYQVQLSILRMNTTVNTPDKYNAEKEELIKALDACLREGRWALLVLNNENSFSFMMEIKKHIDAMVHTFIQGY